MNWKAVKQRSVEWAVVAMLGAIAGAYAQLHAMQITLAQHDVYIELLWRQK